jgi:hypothetical protein
MKGSGGVLQQEPGEGLGTRGIHAGHIGVN